MNKSMTGRVRPNRTWEGIFHDFGNCSGAPLGGFSREQSMEEFDEELQRLLEESIRAHKDDYEMYD